MHAFFDRNYSLLQLTRSYNSNRFTESIIDLNTAIRNQSCDAIQRLSTVNCFRTSKRSPASPRMILSCGVSSAPRGIVGLPLLALLLSGRKALSASKRSSALSTATWNLVRNNGVKYGYHIEAHSRRQQREPDALQWRRGSLHPAAQPPRRSPTAQGGRTINRHATSRIPKSSRPIRMRLSSRLACVPISITATPASSR